MAHPAKGSPAAMAWAAKMQAARKKKGGARKKAGIRESGRKLEEQFFGPGGEVQQSFYRGLQKERREHPERFIAGMPRNNPRGFHNIEKSGFHRGEYVGYGGGVWRIVKYGTGWNAGRKEPQAYFTAPSLEAVSKKLEEYAAKKNPADIGRDDWEREKAYIEAERWKPLGKKNVKAFGRTTGSLYQILQKEAREWRVLYRTFLTAGASPALSLGTYKNLDLALIAANRQANDWARNNPGEAWHKGMEHAAGAYGRRSREPLERAMYKGIEVAHRDSATAARRLGMNPRKERTIRPRHSKNPLAVFGFPNPPKSVNVSVAGILYSRCLEIRAEKLKYKPGLYKHPFTRKAGVQILALDSGDLLVHSTRKVNLWKPV